MGGELPGEAGAPRGAVPAVTSQHTHGARADLKVPARCSVSPAPCGALKLSTGHLHASPRTAALAKPPTGDVEPSPRPTRVRVLPAAGKPVAKEGAPGPCPGSLWTEGADTGAKQKAGRRGGTLPLRSWLPGTWCQGH